MSTTIKLYKSYGVLAHEKRPVYTISAPASDAYDEITVEVPVPVWENTMGELCVTLGGVDYLMQDALTEWGEKPVLVYHDGEYSRRITLSEVRA